MGEECDRGWVRCCGLVTRQWEVVGLGNVPLRNVMGVCYRVTRGGDNAGIDRSVEMGVV